MNEYRVLVTSIGGELGQGICKSLRLSSYPIKIIGTDCREFPLHHLFCDEFKIIPRAESLNYIDFLNDYIKNENIDLAYICTEIELFYICDNLSLLGEDIKQKLVINPVSVINLCRDKYKTMTFLKEKDFPYPISILFDENSDRNEILKSFKFPLVIKKNIGCGSRDVHVVSNISDLNHALDLTERGIVQEYISGKEYTNGVYFDPYTHNVHVVTLERTLREGMTFESTVVFDKEIEKLCREIAMGLGITSSINIQLRKNYNQPPIVFEINPRYSSTVFMRANFGFNDVIFAFENIVLKKAVTPFDIKKGSAYRYITEFFKY